MKKGPRRSIIKIGAASTDWSRSVPDLRGYPAMGGAGWARIGQVKEHSFNHWVAGSLHISPGGALGVKTWDDNVHLDCRILVMQRYMTQKALDGVRTARRLGQCIVNDLDDWFWGLHPKNAAYKITDPRSNRRSNIDFYKQILLESEIVVVSTQYLHDQLRLWNDATRIEVIPNGVNVQEFSAHRHTASRCVVGWAGSTSHRSGDLEILRSPFKSLSSINFHHTGANPSAPIFADEVGVDIKRVTTTPMLAPHEYPHGLTFDIGVIPLVDIPFNHAKSNIKGLEYAAAGIPFVASPLPEYVLLAEEYGIGRLAKTKADWVRHITALMDCDVRSEEAERQRAAIHVNKLDAKTQARRWDDLLWSVQ